MLEKERGGRVSLMEPLIRDAFGKVAKVVAGMIDEDVRKTLDAMAADPTECFIWEGLEVRACDRYEAGGPLEAEISELNVSPELSDMTREQLLMILNFYHQDGSVQFVGTSDPWKVFTRAQGSPTATVYVLLRPSNPLDLVVRIVLGRRDLTSDFLPRAGIALAWQKATPAAMQLWVRTNQQRALSDHPAFEYVVQKLQPGLPGLYIIRTPPVPFSPVLPVASYQHRAGAAVFETFEEYEQCERFYSEIGAAFFQTPPHFRNRPPFAYLPARLADGIEEGRAMVVQTPWPDVGAVSLYVMPASVLASRPDLKSAGFRERYGVQFDKDMTTAAEFWRRFPGDLSIEAGRAEHPRTARRS